MKSKRMVNAVLASLMVMSLVLSWLPSYAYAWGSNGHGIVASVGSKLTSTGNPFWAANSETMRQLSTVPDRVWKRPATKQDERANHWFQADAYYPSVSNGELGGFPKSYTAAVTKYGESVILNNGTAPWRIRQFYNMGVQALRTGDYKTAMQLAGVMSHYIGDLSQPLHVSENYDGQQTNNTGIHKFFETDNIKDVAAIEADVLDRAQALLRDPNFIAHFQGDLFDVTVNEIARALVRKDAVLQIDTQQGRGPQGQSSQLELAKERMADGAATLSIVMSRMYRDAGATIRATPVPVPDPDWIAPVFSDTNIWLATVKVGGPMLTPLVESECD